MSWKQVESGLIPIQLFLAMLGMGATLTVRDFLNVVRHPGGVLLGLGQQWLMVPLLALALIALLDLSPGWAVGLLLVAVTPGGAFSNLMTFLARMCSRTAPGADPDGNSTHHQPDCFRL